MRPVSDAFRERLKGRHRRAARITALDASFEAIPGGVLTGEDGYAIEGSVTIDRRRNVRRTCSLTIANPEGVWTPQHVADFFFFGNLIRIERGVFLSATEVEWCSLGVFVIDTPTTDVRAAGTTLQVRGQDRMKRAAYSKFATPTTYASGSRVRDAIADLALDAGMGDVLLSLDDDGKTLAADRTFDEQEERVAAMVGLARDYALDLYVDADGVLRLHSVTSPISAPVAWEFTRGDEAVMLGITKGFSDQRFYNHVVVIGEAADQTPVRAEAFDGNPASPGYVGGPFGDRTLFYSSAMIRTVGQAQDVANAMLPEVALLEEEIRLPIVPNPALEAGDAIQIVEPISRTNDRYFIDAITIPIGRGASSIQTKKVRSLS